MRNDESPLRRLIITILVVLLFALFPHMPKTLAGPSPTEPLLGSWSGQVRYGEESKAMSLRFALGKNDLLVAFFDLPDLKFRNFGPLPIKQDGREYKAAFFIFRLASDNNIITGIWSFDGNELPFELKPGSLPVEPPSQEASGRVAQPLWTFKTNGAIWSSPAVAANTVYFGSSDGAVYALQARSGKLVWRFTTGAPVMGHPTIDAQYLYVVSDDGKLYKLLQSNGKEIWHFDTHGGSVLRHLPTPNTDNYDDQTSAATVVDGVVYVGSANNCLYAVDAKTGAEKWHFETKGSIRSIPAVANGLIFFGSRDHHVYAVESKTGSLRWKYDTLREVVSSPLVVDGMVYVGSRCSNLFAFVAATGEVKWKFFYWSSWVESSARMRDGVLYIGSSDSQQLHAINPLTGHLIWRFDTDGSDWSTPAVTDRRVYIGAVGVLNYFIPHHGGFFAVDRGTGKIVWRYPMTAIPNSDLYGVASSPVVDHEHVFFGGLDGTFYAFRSEG
jgi:outer membrane protein assembly factor BamB